ncbi:MAG: hypothetical protein EOO80_19125 [Oxalobacteraceae bacterium]|nr:MAG: hypothetical protein EOO80_19125 [Oxalobacteraceae bacterium]
MALKVFMSCFRCAGLELMEAGNEMAELGLASVLCLLHNLSARRIRLQLHDADASFRASVFFPAAF